MINQGCVALISSVCIGARVVVWAAGAKAEIESGATRRDAERTQNPQNTQKEEGQ